jgi:DNA repair protein RecO (recombination protein O)
MFQPLTQLEIEANHKDKGTLETIREAKVSYQYRNLHTDIAKTSVVFFISDMLRSTIIEEEENSLLFDYLTASTIWLDTHDVIANFHLLFLVKLTEYLGFYPDQTHSHYEYFNLIEGTFEASEINIYCQNGTQIKILKELLGIKFDALPEIKLNQKQRSDFLTMLLQYYELHLHGFKKPRSLAVLNSIFT